MRFSLRTFSLLLLLVLLASGITFHVLLNRIANSDEFKHFAEKRVSEYLKAQVHIGKIRPYHFNQIALEKIIIELPTLHSESQLVHIERLLFRYHLSQLWERRFDAPAAVVLKNPMILIDQNQFPYQYLGVEAGNVAGFSIPSLDFKGGEIQYLLPGSDQKIILSEVTGKITPSLKGAVQIDIRAKTSGLLQGRVRIAGSVEPRNRSHHLNLELEGIDFSKEVSVPVKDIRGRVQWVNQDLFFNDLQATVYGWETSVSGDFINGNGQPAMTLKTRVGKGSPWLKGDLSINLFLNQLAGVVQIASEPEIRFEGQLRRDGKRFWIKDLKAGPGFEGRGELDFLTGNYELVFEKGTKRLAFHSNLRGLDFALYFHLNHWQVFGLDLVTQGKLFLHSKMPQWRGKSFLFQGDFVTDYFILEKQPFEDFAGSFEVNPYGIFGIRTSWGNKFTMTGEVVSLMNKPKGKFLVRVSDFDLSQVQTFAAKPLPKEMGGQLEGRLSIEGELKKPELRAVFNIHDGKWGQLSYDRGIIQCWGFLPYFSLEGSKIMKGRSTFALTGAIDMRLDNVFAGVKIETPDHLVIWKGIEAVLHSKDGSLEMNRSRVGNWGELSVLEARSKGSTGSRPEEEGRRESQEEEMGVKFGPTLKF